jgi:hypothetical protein
MPETFDDLFPFGHDTGSGGRMRVNRIGHDGFRRFLTQCVEKDGNDLVRGGRPHPGMPG